MGCQDLLEEVPGRSPKDQGVFSSPTDAKSWYKLKPSSSKSYSIKDDTSSKFLLKDYHLISLPVVPTFAIFGYCLLYTWDSKP